MYTMMLKLQAPISSRNLIFAHFYFDLIEMDFIPKQN